MKKTLVILVTLLVSFATINQNSNAQAFEKGRLLFDAGMGVPYYSNVLMPPVYVNLEMGIHDYIGIGLTGGF
jgi:hypothetical protein